MRAFLSDRLVIATWDDPDKIQRLVANQVADPGTYKRWSPPRGYYRPYEGEVVNYRFEVKRVIQNRNSFNPLVCGTITPKDGGSLIELSLKVHPAVRAFLVAWVLFLIWIGLAPVAQTIDGQLGLQSFLPLIM